MAGVLYGPDWFFGETIIIDLVGVFVLSVLSYFSIKYYKIKKNKNHLYLIIAFILLIISFLAKNLISLGIHYNLLDMGELGFGKISYGNMASPDTLIFVFYFLYHVITLLGLYFFYSVYQKQSKSSIALMFYFVLVSSYFGHYSNALFFLSSFALLLIITLQCIQRYISKKYPATRLLILSLALITLSQAFFIAASASLNFYVAGEFVQLAGYIILLITLIAVLMYGRKKDQNRYYW